jgi:hypothetical protein
MFGAPVVNALEIQFPPAANIPTHEAMRKKCQTLATSK